MTLGSPLALLVALAGPSDSAHASRAAETTDTLRPRATAESPRHRRPSRLMGSTVLGYLSPRGLPPQAGQVIVTDSGLVFVSADGRTTETYPLVRRRAAAVSLAYVEEAGGRPIYVFRLDGGVFATEGPGSLLALAERPEELDTAELRGWPPDRRLVPAKDSAAIREVTARISTGAYADTLYALFGRPARPFGLVGRRGRRAGRLGEYVAQRDSVALDPARMISEDQLRHALAHELGHRWQSRAPAQLTVLWHDIPRIRDPKRYGHASITEHQAEAIAFAVHFLQVTGGSPPADASALLSQYERLVPGTSLMARYLALQPIYAGHPLRHELTTGSR